MSKLLKVYFFLLSCLLSETFLIQTNKHVKYTVRGRKLQEGQYPFFAQISIPGHMNQECGGTLINPMWILTAAHCFMNSTEVTKNLVQHNKIKVYMGTNKHIAHAHDAAINFVDNVYIHPNFSRYERGGISTNKHIEHAHDAAINFVDNVYIHPNFSRYERGGISCLVYDIALAQLKYAYKLSSRIQTLYLPQSELNRTSERCKIGIIIGMGNKESKYMLTANIHEKSIEQLEIKLPKPLIKTLFFAEVLLNNSGGPYFCLNENGIPVQYGVRSREGVTDDVANLGVYEAVNAHIDFILHHVSNFSTYEERPLWYLKAGGPINTSREVPVINMPVMFHEKGGSDLVRYCPVVLIISFFAMDI